MKKEKSMKRLKSKTSQRIIAFLMIAALIVTTVIAGMPAKQVEAEEKQELDEGAYKALGFETDITDPEEGYFGESEYTVLNPEKELYFDINGSRHYGWVMRDSMFLYRDDIKTDSLLEPGAYKLYGQYYNGKDAKLSEKNGYTTGRQGGRVIGSALTSENSHLQRAYATSTEYKSASGYDDRVAELYVVSNKERAKEQVYLSIAKFTEGSNGRYDNKTTTSTVNLGTPEALDQSGYWYNEQLDALFEITAGDYDGDGLDEVAVYYADNTVKVYRTANDRLSLWKTISSAEISAATGVTMKTDSGTTGTKAAVVSLASGDLKKDYSEDLVIGVSMPTDSDANKNNNVFIYGYDKEKKSLAQDKIISLNHIEYGEEERVMKAVNVTVGDLDGNALPELVIAGRLEKKRFDVITPDYDTLAAVHVAYNFDTKIYKVSDVQTLTDGINSTLLNSSQIGPGYYAPVGLSICDFGTLAESDQKVFIFDQLYSYIEGSGFQRQNYGLSFSLSQKNNANEDRDKGAVWISKVVSANMIGDDEGSEQLAAIVGVRDAKTDDYWYEICFLSKEGNTWYQTWEGVVNQASSYLNNSSKSRSSVYVSFSLPDVDKDTKAYRFMEAGAFYTKPEVFAVLQSAPYFQDVADLYDNYLDDSSTSFGENHSTGDGVSGSVDVSTGVYTSEEIQMGVSQEMELSISAGVSYEHQTMWETSTSVEYSGNAGDDYVVMYTVPYHTYLYEYYDANGNREELLIEEPQTAATVLVPIATYDALTEYYQGLEPIGGNILTSTPGEPSTYMTTFKGKDYTKVGDTQALTNAGSNSGSSVTVSREESVSYDHAIEGSVSHEGKVGWGGGIFGNKWNTGITWSVEVSAGYVRTSAEGTTFSGCVDSLPSGVSGYGFNWQFGIQKAQLNGEETLVLGYQLSNVKELPRSPKNLTITEITSNSMTLVWDSTTDAAVYELMLITNNGMELPQATIPGTQVKNDGSLTYEVTNLTPNTQYSYSVVAVNGSGMASLSSAIVSGTTLPEEQSAGFKILKQPEDIEVGIGKTAHFTIEVENNLDGALNYRWQTYDSSAKTWKYITGAYDTSLDVVGEAENNGARYRCIVYRGGTLLTSSVAVLTIGKSDSVTDLRVTNSAGTRLNNNAVVKATTTGTEMVESETEVLKTVTQEIDGVIYTKLQNSDGVILWRTTGADGNEVYYIDNNGSPAEDSCIVAEENIFTLEGDSDTSYTTRGEPAALPDNVTSPIEGVSKVYEQKNEDGTTGYIFVKEEDIEDTWEDENGNQQSGSTTVVSYYDDDGKKLVLSDSSQILWDETTQTGYDDVSSFEEVTELRKETVKTEQSVTTPGDKLTFALSVTDKNTNEAVTDSTPSFQITDVSTGLSSGVTAVKNGDGYEASYTFTEPGVYKITAVYSGSEAYNMSRSESITLLVQGEARQLYLSGGSVTYGSGLDLNPTIITANSGSQNANVTYTVTKGDENISVSTVMNGNVFYPRETGTYQITAKTSDGLTAVSSVVVSKRTLTITPADITANVTTDTDVKTSRLNDTKSTTNTSDVEGKVTIQGLAGSDTITDYDLQSSALTAASIGEYPIEVVLQENSENIQALSENYTMVLNRGVYTLTQDSHQVNVSAGANGTITARYTVPGGQPVEIQSGTYVPEGAKVSITAQPATGFGVEKWVVNGETVSSNDTTYTIDSLDEDVDISVSFSYKYSKLTFGGSGSGTVTGVYEGSGQNAFASGNQLNQKQSVVLTATPDEGYVIDHWTIQKGTGAAETILAEDGIHNYTNETYTVSNVTEDTTIQVFFAAKEEKTVTLQFKGLDNDVNFVTGTSLKINGEAVKPEGYTYTYRGSNGDNLALDITIPDSMLVYSWVIVDGDGNEKTVANSVKEFNIYDLEENSSYIVYCSMPNTCEVDYEKVLVDTNGGTVEAAGEISASVTPNTITTFPTNLPQGTDIVFKAVPAEGYRISKWTVEGKEVTSVKNEDGSESYSMAVLSNATVQVYFEKKPTIIYGVEGNTAAGTVTAYDDTKLVANGGNVEFGDAIEWTIAPVKGYDIETVTLNGEDITSQLTGSSNSKDIKYFTLDEVKANQNLKVTFRPLAAYEVEYTVVDTDNDGEGDHGTIQAAASRLGIGVYEDTVDASVDGVITVYEDGEVILTPIAETEEYRMRSCTVNGKIYAPQADGTIRLTAEQLAEYEDGKTIVTVQFGAGAPIITYETPTFGGKAAGSISATAAGAELRSGASVDGTVTFTVVPDDNYEIKEWLVNGSPVEGETGNTFVYANKSRIDSDVTAVLQGVKLNVTAAAEDETAGTVETLPETIRYQDALTLTAKANTGYEFDGWYLDGQKVSDTAVYELTAVEDASYVAKFVSKQEKAVYNITMAETEHGTVSVQVNGESVDTQTAITVEEGDKVTFTAAADVNWSFGTWTLNGQETAYGESFTVTAGQAFAEDIAVAASFNRAIFYDVEFGVETGKGTVVGVADDGTKTEITPDTEIQQVAGSELTFTAEPEEGFMVAEWTINGEPVEDNLSRTLIIDNLSENTEVKVSFKEYAGYEIPATNEVYTVAEDVVRTPADTTPENEIREGGTVTFTLAPTEGTIITALNLYGVDALAVPSGEAQTVKVGEESTTITVVKNEESSYTITIANVQSGIRENLLVETAALIDDAKITVTGDETFVYNGKAQTPSRITVTLKGETLTADDYDMTCSDNVNAGTAKITVTGKGKYRGTATGTFVIGQRPLTVIANNISKNYSYADPALTYRTEGLISGDRVNVSLKRAQGENPGTYPIAVSATAGANYKVSCQNGFFTIKDTKLSSELVNKLNAGLMTSWNGRRLTVKWGIVSVADGYDVFVVECGKSYPKKPSATVTKPAATQVKLTKAAGKKLNPTKEYKVVVKAFRMADGKKEYIATSYSLHRAGKNSRSLTNVKKIKVKKKTYSLKKGKTAKLKVTLTKENKKKRLITHASMAGKGVRYWSSDKKIATVTNKGKIKAVGTGNCIIYIMADDGVKVQVKVTVK